MAPIRNDLLAKIMSVGGIKKAAAYDRIKSKANELWAPRDVAALAVAAELDIPINKYATPEQMERLQSSSRGRTSARSSPEPAAPRQLRVRNTGTKKMSKTIPNTVFVVHGRDTAVAESMFQLLRALGLNPIEWNVAVGYTKNAAPSIYSVIQKAFERAVAAVILFTPDEQVQLHEQFRDPDDDDEAKVLNQARPNVYFEAGIALALRPKSTVLVEVGKVRRFTDISGLHVVRLSQSSTSRNNLVTKLKNAGLKPNTTGNHWMTVGNFTPTEAATQTRRRRQT